MAMQIMVGYLSQLCRRFTRLGQPASRVWLTRLITWVNAWDAADENVVQTVVAHTEDSYDAYLRWYLPRTRSRATYPDVAPVQHVPSSQDTYPRYRDEALAETVS